MCDENENCHLKKCPNYILCNVESPEWCFGFDKSGMCTNCILIFGIWNGGRGKPDIKDNIECPICLQTKTCITQPKCTHFTCIDCFRRCQYGDETFDIENKPKFPYDEDIEKEYYEALETPFLEISEIKKINKEWENIYPLIKEYNIELNEWEDKQFENSIKEENLSHCPICRQ